LSIKIIGLKCENMVDPLGIDVLEPRFSWQLSSEEKEIKQTSYRIFVSSTREKALSGDGDYWDSGIVESSNSIGIGYKGEKLKSSMRCWWSVRVWCNKGMAEADECAAFFEMGLLDKDDWQGCFIGFPSLRQKTAQFFRYEFNLTAECIKGRAYVCVPGYFELYVNARKVGDHILDPGNTDYTKTLLYVTHDITGYLDTGENVIAILIGNGWYNKPMVLLQCNLDLSDGSKVNIFSSPDDSWTAGTSPITYNDVFGGETYDSRFEKEGWNEKGSHFREKYPKRYWHYMAAQLPVNGADYSKNANIHLYFSRYQPIMLPSPGGKIKAQKMEAIKVVEDLRPVDISEPKPGIYVFDMGENMAGWVRMKLSGPKDSIVSIKHAEVLFDDGTVNRESLHLAEGPEDMQHDRYVLSGKDEEYFEPRFTYHGFRYVQVEGLSFTPDHSTITGRRVRSSVKKTGEFNCSDDLLTFIHQNMQRTEACNLHSIPTDCPQRDERCGWLNDMTVRAEEAVYNFFMDKLYHKWIGDIYDCQDKITGAIGDTAPYRRGFYPADPVDSSYLIAAWLLYEYYGNRKVIEEFYDGFVKLAEFLNKNSIDDIVNYGCWGDWCPPAEYASMQHGAISKITPNELISTAFSYYNFKILIKMAEVLGRQQDMEHFSKTAERIASSFNRHFFDYESCNYATGSQSCNAIAVYMGIAPEKYRKRIVDNIVQDIRKKNMHVTSGNLCTRYIFEVLSEYGYCDVAVELMQKTDYPSYGFMVKNGATTIWERWEYQTGKAMNSHNHPMFASTDVWYYKHLAGIRTDYNKPAFEHIIIKPAITKKLSFVDAKLDTVRGMVHSAWQWNGENLELSVTIPPNSEAVIYIPLSNEKCSLAMQDCGTVLVEGNKTAKAQIVGIKDCAVEGSDAIITISSGSYGFVLNNDPI